LVELGDAVDRDDDLDAVEVAGDLKIGRDLDHHLAGGGPLVTVAARQAEGGCPDDHRCASPPRAHLADLLAESVTRRRTLGKLGRAGGIVARVDSRDEGPDTGAFAATALADAAEDLALAGTVSSGAALRPPRSDVTRETLRPFGPFTHVERLTEQGAMGVVARGYNAAFDRWELLKFIHPDLENRPEFVRQFFREGRVLAKLSHPNIVQVFAIYTLDGRPCLAMEFLDGTSLAAEVARERCPIARWHELFLEAARGLAAAHDVGLLHRDIKPENLFVVQGRGGAARLKLIDFGLATADRSRATDAANDPTLVAAMSGGTPLYMAPELWRGEEASPRTDLYSLGLSFFFAVTGRLPFTGDTVGQLRAAVCSEEPFPDAREMRPDLPAPLARALSLAIAKRKEGRLASADELVGLLVAATSAARPRRVPGAGPYRGLSSYGAAERDVFFGRDREIVEVLEHLRTQSGVVLVGPSSSGKSSLALAGVVPSIEDGALGGGIAYGSALVQPRARPAHSLAAGLARRLGSSEKDVLAFVQATPESLGETLRAALPADAGLVLVLDQLEELATLAEDAAEVRRFAVAVSSLLDVGSAPIRVVATLRADLMDRLFAIEPLRPLLTRGFYPVRPMGPEALEQAMLGPALAAGYRLEDPSIVATIVRDVGQTASGLPLLSFAMSAWWDARDEPSRTLPTAAWRALGGLTGALTRSGDRVLEAMTDDSRRVAEQLLLRLVSADRTRLRARRASLLDPAAAGAGAAQVLDRLLAAKLVHESSGEIELAHDALITQWSTLRELLVSSGEDRAFRERVTAASREWDAQRRPDGALWSSDQAARLARWFATTNATLDQLELAFIEAVRRRTLRTRWVARAIAGGAVLVAMTYALVARSNEHEVRRRLDAANRSLAAEKAAYVRAETGRLDQLASLEIEHDPAAAIRHAAASYELEHDGSLDVMAWNARARGFGVVLAGLGAPVTAVATAPGARWLAAASAGTVTVLAGASSEHVRIEAMYEGAVRTLAFSTDGATLAIGTASGEVALARAPAFTASAAGRCAGSVVEIAWSGGDTLQAVCRDGGAADAVVIDLRTGKSEPGPPPAPTPDGITRSTLPVAGASVAIDSNRRLELHVDAAGNFEAEVGSRAFTWIPARNAAALVGLGGEVLVVSLASLEVIGRLQSPHHAVVSLAADTAGEWLLAGARDGAVIAWNLDQATTTVTQARLAQPPSACALSPDGAAVACASGGSLVVRAVDGSLAVPRAAERSACPTSVDAVDLGPGGRPAFVLAGDELLRDGRPPPRLLTPGLLEASDRRVAVAGLGADGLPAVVVAPLDFERWPAPIHLPTTATALAWTASGVHLVVAGADQQVRMFDPAAESQPRSFGVPGEARIRAVAASDDGSRIVAGTEAGEVFVSGAAGAALRRIAALGAPIRCLAVGQAGRAIVASADRRVFVIDGDTGLSFVLGSAASAVAHCARSPVEDRFSFVDDGGAAWLKALDLRDVAESYVPRDDADVPLLATWKGLPVGLVR
jgi:tRNA A-37 threonylcarbamoyl transferase component Bud32